MMKKKKFSFYKVISILCAVVLGVVSVYSTSYQMNDVDATNSLEGIYGSTMESYHERNNGEGTMFEEGGWNVVDSVLYGDSDMFEAGGNEVSDEYKNKSDDYLKKSSSAIEKAMFSPFVSAVLSVWTLLSVGNIPVSIDNLVYGRMAMGDKSGLFEGMNEHNADFTHFGMETNNPYGIAATTIYYALRDVILALIPIILIVMLIMQMFQNGAKGRARLKEMVQNFVIVLFLLYAMPYLMNLFLYVRDACMYLMQMVMQAVFREMGLAQFNYGNSVVLYVLSMAVNSPNLLTTILAWAAVGASIMFFGYYITIALLLTACFGIFPLVAFISIWNRRILTEWWNIMFPNALLPFIDLLLLQIPSLVYAVYVVVFGEEMGIVIVFILISIMFATVKVRTRVIKLLGFDGLPQGNNGVLAMAVMLMRTIGKKPEVEPKPTNDPPGAIKQAIDETTARGTLMDNADKKISRVPDLDMDKIHDIGDERTGSATDEFLSGTEGDSTVPLEGNDGVEMADADVVDGEMLSMGEDVPERVDGMDVDPLDGVMEPEMENIPGVSAVEEMDVDGSVGTTWSGEQHTDSDMVGMEGVGEVPVSGRMDMPEIDSTMEGGTGGVADYIGGEPSADILSDTDASSVPGSRVSGYEAGDDNSASGIPVSVADNTASSKPTAMQWASMSDEEFMNNISGRDKLRYENLVRMDECSARLREGERMLSRADYDASTYRKELSYHQNRADRAGQSMEKIRKDMEAIAPQERGTSTQYKQLETDYKRYEKERSSSEARIQQLENARRIDHNNSYYRHQLEAHKAVESQYAHNSGLGGMSDKQYYSAEEFKHTMQVNKIKQDQINYKNFDSKYYENILTPQERVDFYREREIKEREMRVGELARKAAGVAGGVVAAGVAGAFTAYGGSGAAMTGAMLGYQMGSRGMDTLVGSAFNVELDNTPKNQEVRNNERPRAYSSSSENVLYRRKEGMESAASSAEEDYRRMSAVNANRLNSARNMMQKNAGQAADESGIDR